MSTIVRHLKQKVSAEKGPYAERPTAITFSKWVANALEGFRLQHSIAVLEYSKSKAILNTKKAFLGRVRGGVSAPVDEAIDSPPTLDQAVETAPLEGVDGVDAAGGDEVTDTTVNAKKKKVAALMEKILQCEQLKERDLDKIHLHEDSQIRLLHACLGKSPEVVVHYLRAHVFPRVMEHQNFKLQASGVDLGSDVRRADSILRRRG
jgi:hypothetical protein